MRLQHRIYFFFFFNDTATTEIYTLSLHDALPICSKFATFPQPISSSNPTAASTMKSVVLKDRKSTRLNSSHGYISYAVFCLKKKIILPPEHREALTATPVSHCSRTAHEYLQVHDP